MANDTTQQKGGPMQHGRQAEDQQSQRSKQPNRNQEGSGGDENLEMSSSEGLSQGQRFNESEEGAGGSDLQRKPQNLQRKSDSSMDSVNQAASEGEGDNQESIDERASGATLVNPVLTQQERSTAPSSQQKPQRQGHRPDQQSTRSSRAQPQGAPMQGFANGKDSRKH